MFAPICKLEPPFNLHISGLWGEAGETHTDNGDSNQEPGTFLLYGNTTNHCTTLPPYSKVLDKLDLIWTVIKILYSKQQMSPSWWHYRNIQGISKYISIHHLWSMFMCTKFHGNASWNILQHKKISAQIPSAIVGDKVSCQHLNVVCKGRSSHLIRVSKSKADICLEGYLYVYSAYWSGFHYPHQALNKSLRALSWWDLRWIFPSVLFDNSLVSSQ